MRCKIHNSIYTYTAMVMEFPITFGEVFSESGLSAAEFGN